MSETAATVIKSALQEILVQASEAPLDSDEYKDAILYLNRMMSSLAAKGINLGYTAVSTLGDTITVPDGALDGIVKNLAVSLFPQFSAPGTAINPLLVSAAQDGMETMLMLSVSISPTQFSDTLPIGSGNEQDGLVDGHFYTESDDPILTEQSGYISVEQSTPIP